MKTRRLTLALVSAALVALPYLLVRFPPVTDLPQHLAQLRLFEEIRADPDGLYRLRPWMPYSAVYTVGFGLWTLVGPERTGPIWMAALAVFWVLSVHFLAHRRALAPESAVWASAFFFSPVTYWGFLSFAFGSAVFCYWLVWAGEEARPRRAGNVALGVALGALLYASHVLWLAAAAAVTCFEAVLHRSWRRGLVSLAVLMPALGLAAWLGPQLTGGAFAGGALYDLPVWRRLIPDWIALYGFGGLRGAWDAWFLIPLTLWLLVGARQSRGQAKRDTFLLSAAALFAIATGLLPDNFHSTILFAARWLPYALCLGVMALPAPSTASRLLRALPVLALSALSLLTVFRWRTFERQELTGFEDALQALPPTPRVLGLTAQPASQIIRGRPFIQLFAYSQVYRGGRLNFSFAELPPFPAVFRKPLEAPWTPGLEWFPERVQLEDAQHFDAVLIQGSPDDHARLKEKLQLEPLSRPGAFGLYRPRRPDPSP